MREQCIGLEYRVDVTLVRRDSLYEIAADPNEPGVWLFEAGQHSQRGGLPAAAGSKQ